MFSFFESPNVKKAKKAAQAAGLLRQQAADKLTIEMGILARLQGVAEDRWRKLLATNSTEAINNDISPIRKAENLNDRMGRLSWALQELHSKHTRASHENSAAAYDEVQSFELELRDAFATLLGEAVEISSELQDLNMRCAVHLKER